MNCDAGLPGLPVLLGRPATPAGVWEVKCQFPDLRAYCGEQPDRSQFFSGHLGQSRERSSKNSEAFANITTASRITTIVDRRRPCFCALPSL